MRLSAIEVSVKPAGSAHEVEIEGGLVMHGEGLEPLEPHGYIDPFRVYGDLLAAGTGFDKI